LVGTAKIAKGIRFPLAIANFTIDFQRLLIQVDRLLILP
jgi:hypothetical protein